MPADDGLIIEQGGVKRRIDFPFRMCLSRDIAKRLIREISRADDPRHVYGWIYINEADPDLVPPAPVRDWAE